MATRTRVFLLGVAALCLCIQVPASTRLQRLDDSTARVRPIQKARADPPEPSRGPVPYGSMEELVRLDRLPRFYPDGTVTRQISSFARDASNNDGFSGQFSYLRYLRYQGEDASLLFEADGPGCIYRLWATAVPEGRILIFIDGAAEPEIDIPFREMFTDQHYPFLAPVAGRGLGGHYSYVPIAWRESCRIVVTTQQVRFYQITWLGFPATAEVEPFRLEAWQRGEGRFAEIRRAWRELGEHPQAPGAGTRDLHRTAKLEAGETLSLPELAGPGTVRALRVTMNPRTAEALRAVRMRISYDGSAEPSVESPIGDFFGNGFEDHAWASLLMGQQDGSFYCYLPMPFAQGARVEFVHDRYLRSREQPPVELDVRVSWETLPQWDDGLGYFHARWNYEYPTTDRRNYTFLRTHGRGHLVGTIQYCDKHFGRNIPYYFEGDEQTFADGQLALHGTGSEDYYNLGWYNLRGGFDRAGDFPLHGGLYYRNPSVAAYRFHLTDPVVFDHVIHHTMQHGGVNEVEAEYASVALWYQDLPADPIHLPAAAVRVRPQRRPFASIEAEQVLRRRDTVRTISEYDEPGDYHFSHGKAAHIDAVPGQPVSVELTVPHRGSFDLLLSYLATPDSPRSVTIEVGGELRWAELSMFAPSRTYREDLDLGRLELERGPLLLHFTPKGTGAEMILDRFQLVPQPWEPTTRDELALAPAAQTAAADGTLELRYDFNDPGEIRDWAISQGDWELVDGVVSQATTDRGRLWHRLPWRGDLQVEYVAKGTTDLSVVLHGDGRTSAEGRGFCFVFGGNRNRHSALIADRERPLLVKEGVVIADVRRFHHLVADKRGDVLTLSADGEEILRYRLLDGEDQQEGYVGILTANRSGSFDRVVIRGTPGR